MEPEEVASRQAAAAVERWFRAEVIEVAVVDLVIGQGGS